MNFIPFRNTSSTVLDTYRYVFIFVKVNEKQLGELFRKFFILSNRFEVCLCVQSDSAVFELNPEYTIFSHFNQEKSKYLAEKSI